MAVLSRVLIILLSLGAGLVNAAAQSNSSAYVTNLSGTVSVIDTMTNTIVATISVGLGPSEIAITPDGTRAYVLDQQDSIISVIDTATYTVVTTIPVRGTAGTAITPDGTQAYVTTPGVGNVSVINIATNTVIATIPVGVAPNGIAITPDGSRAYVANDNSDSVSVIDTTTSTVVATIPVGTGPVAVAITPRSPTPTDKEQCKHHGYAKFGPPAGPFKNQGQCVSYVEHHST